MHKKNNQEIEESKTIKILKKLAYKKNYFFSLLASIAFFSIILYKVSPLFKEKSINGSIIANEAYISWVKSSFEDNIALSNLKYVLKKYPNLKPIYEGNITQGLMIKNDLSKKDLKYASKCINRTKKELPFYSKYSNISILIAKKNYQNALNEAVALKKSMQNDLSFLKDEMLPAGPILYSLNLLRIAILNKELNLKEEIHALNELENYLGYNKEEKEIHPQILKARNAINNTFRENNIQLRDYIIYRRNQLNSNP
ncbi:MAG: hypothetical protein K1060chlam5_01364 [Candidatus Anoxychlamydiales bacterium]|nr:hypothetical protein [Candidatus Anoxychlamydiales bacterium]